jgi:DNA polymerase-3 subunit delta'
MDFDLAYDRISNALESSRHANGYLLIGNIRGMAGELCEKILKRLFGDCDVYAHPDIHFLAPEKKSRIISVEAIRERLITPLSSTSFSGGWKVGVIQGADRLRTESANAFLKMLEEPPPKTVFFLLSDKPEQLLPTIISRCQKITLPDSGMRLLEEPYRSRVIGILADPGLKGISSRAAAASKLAAILVELKDKAAELVDESLEASQNEEKSKDEVDALISSRYREFRTDFTSTLMGWYRDLMAVCVCPPSSNPYDDKPETPLVNANMRRTIESLAAKMTVREAFHFVSCVEDFATSLERNISEEPLLSLLLDRTTPMAEMKK